jgi:uncharacterized sulfatase
METAQEWIQSGPRRVVLVMTDTTRWDMLSCYRDDGIVTPHLDRLANDGVRFDRAYTASPLCAPARSTLFTGTWPHTNGVVANGLSPTLDSKSIGQRLQHQGVRTAYVGKWHLDGTDYFGGGACPDGWERAYWYDMRMYLDELSPEDRVRSRDPEMNASGEVTAEFTFAHRVSDRAIKFLSTASTDDFLLVVSYDEPHHPSLCPPEYAQMYEDLDFATSGNVLDTLEDKPDSQRRWAAGNPAPDAAVQHRYETYLLGAQSFVDAEIGRVIEAVNTFAPDAVVLYTSDHGDMLRSHQLWAKGGAMYDEIARVPLIVRWPGRIASGGVVKPPISHIDIVPTVLDIFGQPIPPFLPGHSLVGLLCGEGSADVGPIYCEYCRYDMDADGFGGFQLMRGVFDGRYKLVIHLTESDELYDLAADPGEIHNLIGDPAYFDSRDHLHDRLIDWMHRTRDPYRGYEWEEREWRVNRRGTSWDGRGAYRFRPDDGYAQRALDYFDGGEVSEFGIPLRGERTIHGDPAD